MKVYADLYNNDLDSSIIQFRFELDEFDEIESNSFNAGTNEKIILRSNTCKFQFPLFLDKLPHPDLLAFAALKIISPYIGKNFEFDGGVSEKFANAIINQYSKINNVKINKDIHSVSLPEGLAVSFSGGVDSIAASFLLENSDLIMTARMSHDEVDNTNFSNESKAMIQTMNSMPQNFNKYIVYSDFMYLSTQGNNCVYPDTYAFTIAAVLLSEKLKFNTIVTGDILGCFTGNQTIRSTNFNSRSNNFYNGIGMKIDYPLNGVSEIITTKIAYENKLLDESSACENGSFKKPCMNCVKCLRKSLIKWALFDLEISKDDLIKLENSHFVKNFQNFQGRRKFNMMPTFKWAFQKIDFDFSEYKNLNNIKTFSLMMNIPVDWVIKAVPIAYENRDAKLKNAIDNLFKYTEKMSEKDFEIFMKLNWEENFS